MDRIPKIVLPLLLAPTVLAAPASNADPTARHVREARAPVVTAAPQIDPRSPDFLDDVGDHINSLLSDIGSDVSSFVASGIPQYFQDFPVGSEVAEELGITEEDLDDEPNEILNFP